MGKKQRYQPLFNQSLSDSSGSRNTKIKDLKHKFPSKWFNLLMSLYVLIFMMFVVWEGVGGYWIMYRRQGCVRNAEWIMNDAIAGNLTGAPLSPCYLQYLQPSVWGDTGEDARPRVEAFVMHVKGVHLNIRCWFNLVVQSAPPGQTESSHATLRK